MGNFKKNNYRDKSRDNSQEVNTEEVQNNGQIEGDVYKRQFRCSFI